MKELKLGDLRGLLPERKEESPYSSNPEICFENPGYNRAIDDISTKNLLDYVEAVVCRECSGRGLVDAYQPHFANIRCGGCFGQGAVIRVKEGE